MFVYAIDRRGGGASLGRPPLPGALSGNEKGRSRLSAWSARDMESISAYMAPRRNERAAQMKARAARPPRKRSPTRIAESLKLPRKSERAAVTS
jgi:hypothetical protein